MMMVMINYGIPAQFFARILKRQQGVDGVSSLLLAGTKAPETRGIYPMVSWNDDDGIGCRRHDGDGSWTTDGSGEELFAGEITAR